jgi:hypothetical protein
MSLVGAFALTSWLTASLAGFASPVDAKACPTLNIGPGTVSPGTGTTSATYTFTVTVADKTGTPPAWVRVVVNGAASNLTAGGTNFKAGVAFSGARRLPVGTWPYSFDVRTGGGNTCTFAGVAPAAVVVVPPPTPKPTAKPTPKPTPRPTAKPTPKPTAKPNPKPAKSTPKPTAKPGSTNSPRPTATATPEAAVTASPTASEPGATPMPTPTASASPTPTSAAGGATGSGPSGGDLGMQLSLDVGGIFAGVTNPLVAWLMTSVGGVLLFLFLVRRPHSDDDSWSAGLVLASEPHSAVAARGPVAAPRPADKPSWSPGAPPAAPRVPQVFATPPGKGAERVKVGYRRVRVSSKPDAVRSVELGRLERGDEVEILESYEGFLRVQTPDGITGWIQRHTVVGDSHG